MDATAVVVVGVLVAMNGSEDAAVTPGARWECSDAEGRKEEPSGEGLEFPPRIVAFSVFSLVFTVETADNSGGVTDLAGCGVFGMISFSDGIFAFLLPYLNFFCLTILKTPKNHQERNTIYEYLSYRTNLSTVQDLYIHLIIYIYLYRNLQGLYWSNFSKRENY